MADAIAGISPILAGSLPLSAVAAASPTTIELAQLPPPTLVPGVAFTATVLGRGENGTLLLQSDQGTLALKTPIALAPGSSVVLRLAPGSPPVVTLLQAEAPVTSAPTSATPASETAQGNGKAATAETPQPAASAAEPARIEIGTVLKAVVLAPAQGGIAPPLTPGTSLLLRLAVTPPAGSDGSAATPEQVLSGTVVTTTSSETVVATSIGTIALEQPLALAPGSTVGLQPLATTPPAMPSEEPPAAGHAWPALEQTLAVLDRIAPDLAARLRSDLAPSSGEKLAGTLLFLMGAIGSGAWPGAKTANALDRAGRGDLRLRLSGDLAELRRLADPPSGDWRVFVLPLMDGTSPHPLRLYLRRGDGGNSRPEDGTRFVLDVEMSSLGALQLDGLVQQKRLDIVLRSHQPIAPELRQEIVDVFRNATSAAGLAGDIVFTTASRFAVAPLDALQAHVNVDA
jgi:hypothetical protein